MHALFAIFFAALCLFSSVLTSARDQRASPLHSSISHLRVLSLSLHPPLLPAPPALLRFPKPQTTPEVFALLKSTSPNNRKSNGSVYLCLLSSKMTGCFNIRLLQDQYQEIGKALGISNDPWLLRRMSHMPFDNLMSLSQSLYSIPGKYYVMDKLQQPL